VIRTRRPETDDPTKTGQSSKAKEPDMPRPYTLFTGQWADLPFEEVAKLASGWGYDGLEIAVSGDHLDAWRWDEPGYVESKLAILDKYNLKVWAISNHLKGQAVCDDPIDFRHQAIVGAKVWGDGDPEGVRQRAAEEMKHTARLAKALGVDTVVGFTGSSIWQYVAMFPPVPEKVIEAGYQDFADRWNPILDVFDDCGVRFAHEVHPSEIAYDYWTTVRTLQGPDLPRGLQGHQAAPHRPQHRHGLPPALGRPAPRLGLRLRRTRRRALGIELPGPHRHRLQRTDLRGMGRRGHGPTPRRPRSPSGPQEVRLPALPNQLRRRLQAVAHRGATSRDRYGQAKATSVTRKDSTNGSRRSTAAHRHHGSVPRQPDTHR
jgi:sugar phosphate isomerase/epimerase